MELSVACSSSRRRCFILECPEFFNKHRHTGAHCFFGFHFIHHNDSFCNGTSIHDKSNDYYSESKSGLGDEFSTDHDVITYDSFQRDYPLMLMIINTFIAIFLNFMGGFYFSPLDKRTFQRWISSLILVPHFHRRQFFFSLFPWTFYGPYYVFNSGQIVVLNFYYFTMHLQYSLHTIYFNPVIPRYEQLVSYERLSPFLASNTWLIVIHRVKYPFGFGRKCRQGICGYRNFNELDQCKVL